MTDPQVFASAVGGRLDDLAGAGRQIAMWWRDDDAVAPSAALDSLLGTARRYDVPVALAVIPEPATPALAARLAGERAGVVVLQHGYAHRNHAPPGEKAAELGPHRPAGAVLDELSRGRERLEELFGARFLPVLTPPWNRIGEEVARRRGEAGLAWLSTFGRMHGDDGACVNTHVDIIDWKRSRRFAGFAKMAAVLDEEIGRRAGAATVPIGLLTHHLDHDEAAWRFLEAFLSVATRHPAVRWPRLRELFGHAAAAG